MSIRHASTETITTFCAWVSGASAGVSWAAIIAYANIGLASIASLISIVLGFYAFMDRRERKRSSGTVEVIINSKRIRMVAGRVGYSTLARLAGFPEGVRPTMTFRAKSLGLAGSLCPDETVELQDGMVIVAADTSNA